MSSTGVADRRGFLKVTGVLTGCLAVGSPLALLAPSRAWALDLAAFTGEQGAILLAAARTLLPHDGLDDAAYAALGLDWVYVAFEVPAGQAGDALDAVAALGLVGLSVTMPHKTDAAARCDELSDTARRLDSVNTVTRLDDGRLSGDSTDGRIAALDLVALVDDRRYFPPYEAVPLARAEALRLHPGLRPALDRLAGRLDAETMRRLNSQVDGLKRSPAEVAREFLRSEGLIGTRPGKGRDAR